LFLGIHDAALLRQTALDFDKLKPEVVISRMAQLAKPDSPWFGSAAELTAVAMIKQGRKLVTACTPVVLFTGHPDRVQGELRT